MEGKVSDRMRKILKSDKREMILEFISDRMLGIESKYAISVTEDTIEIREKPKKQPYYVSTFTSENP